MVIFDIVYRLVSEVLENRKAAAWALPTLLLGWLGAFLFAKREGVFPGDPVEGENIAEWIWLHSMWEFFPQVILMSIILAFMSKRPK